MRSARFVILLFTLLLLLVTIACGFSVGDAVDRAPQAVETAEAAARGAGIAAQTAAAQAGDLAATAAVVATTEGSEALATVMAAATPHVDLLKEKLGDIEPDADGNYRVTLEEGEVNTVLRLRQLLSGDLIGAGIQSQEVRFREGSITLSGQIMEPLPGDLLVIMRPSVVEGRLQLEIVDASAAGQAAPQATLDAAREAIGSSLGEALDNLPAGVELVEITAANGELTIAGRKVAGE